MDDGLVYIGIGVVVLVIAIYFKFIKKEDLSNSQTKKEEKKTAVEKIDYTYGKINFYYGSQTGTAEKFSKILEEEAKENYFEPEVIDLKGYEQQKLNSGELSVFLMATHGEGEPTDNAQTFFKWLSNKDTEEGALSKMRFIVFGLGNSQYEHYNFMGRKTNEHLERLGAKRFYKYGEGDDNASLEDDFNEWKSTLWSELKQILPKIPLQQVGDQDLGGTQLNKQQSNVSEYAETQSKSIDVLNYEENNLSIKYDFQTEKFLKAKNAQVLKITEIRQNNEDGSTLHIEIDLSKAKLEYKSAMNLGVYPQNSEENVQKVAQYLGLQLNQVLKLDSADGKLPFPQPINVYSILKYFCDITGPVMKSQLKKIVKITTDEQVVKELTQLQAPSGKQQFESEIKKQHMNIVDILQKYNIKPTITQFIQLVPRISPRLFTISSSNLKYPNEVHITDSLTYTNIKGQVKYGLCSKYFYDMYQDFKKGQKSAQIRIDFTPSNFILPQGKQPVLMIGPGTGIAPFIAFSQDKEYLLENGIDKCPGEFTLYFGCRHENGDYIFKDELQKYQKNKIINNYYCAFSRDQAKKVYVQDLLEQNQKEISDLLFNKNAQTFICGSTAMGISVKNALINVAQQYKNISHDEAQKLINDMETNKQIIKELWES